MDLIAFAEGHAPWQIEPADLAAVQSDFYWLDITRAELPALSGLMTQLVGSAVHEKHQSDLANKQHPSFYDATHDYELLLFRSLAPVSADNLLDTRSTAFILTATLLITVREADGQSIPALRQRLLNRQTRIPRRPIGLAHAIMSDMVDRFLERRAVISEQVKVWRRDLLDPRSPFEDWPLVLEFGSRLRELGTLCEEQQEAVMMWKENTPVEIDEHLAIRMTDLQEHINRVESFSRNQNGDIDALVQLHFSAVAHRTNEIMRVLTVISAIFLPLSLVAGIFGMNFENMPELKYPHAYFIALSGMGVLGVGLFVLFKLRRWV